MLIQLKVVVETKFFENDCQLSRHYKKQAQHGKSSFEVNMNAVKTAYNKSEQYKNPKHQIPDSEAQCYVQTVFMKT